MVLGLKDHMLARLGPRGVRLGLKDRLGLWLAGRLGYWARLGLAGRRQGHGPTALSISLSLLSLIDWSRGAVFSFTIDMRGPHVSGTGI